MNIRLLQKTVWGQRSQRSVARYFVWSGAALAVLIFLVGGIAVGFLEAARQQTKVLEESYWPRAVGAQRLAVDASHLTALTAELPSAVSNTERLTVLQRINGERGALVADMGMLRTAGLDDSDLARSIMAEQALMDGTDALNELNQGAVDLRSELALQKDMARAACKVPIVTPECRSILWALAVAPDDAAALAGVPGLAGVALAQRNLAANEQRHLNLLRRQSELAAHFLFLASSQSADAIDHLSQQRGEILKWTMRIEWVLGATMMAALILVLGLRFVFRHRVVPRMRALEAAMINWRQEGVRPVILPLARPGEGDEIDSMGTALRELLGEIANRTTELTRSNAELEQFAYVASHDLRQPLRMVTSYMSVIERSLADKLDDDTRQYMAFARDGAKKMDLLILDLLDYSRIGRQGAPMEPVDLTEVVREAVANLVVAIEDAKAVLTTPPEWPTVIGSRSELVRLYQNLLGNAVKYRAADEIPAITVTCRRDREVWVVSIRDNGIGIAPDQRERVFGVFQRLHTSQQYEGTGIGLAICRKIVERHGGRIWVEAADGPGSEFCFTLPMAVLPHPTSSITAKNASP